MSSIRSAIPSLNSLALFEASARLLNFSKAAEELALTQSAISHGIKQLEAALGVPLFLRRHRALELTPEGERLYRCVAVSLAAIAETVDAISGRPSPATELVIAVSTAMAAYWLLPRIAGFRRLYPDIRLRIQTVDRDPDLVAEHIDLCLLLGHGKWPAYDTLPLWAEEIYAVCSGQHLRDGPPVTSPQDLLRRPLIHYDDPYRHRADWWEWLGAMGVDAAGLKKLLRLNDYAVTLQAAMDGQGVSLGWRPIIDDLVASGRLVIAYPQPLVTERHFFATTPKGARLRKPVALFTDWLVDLAKGRNP